ncbi:hypothetical protein EB118_01330 [bacterium]|nr:hypothetical protein [bacterium]NBX97887.1 hypothetical protein [bacterium]NDC93873.1 hypothetical protein [bacterium]NDD82820.1 hypothetical protein [bacterium]NDG28731.1 hypothetical protein [bacterium]
MTDDAPAYGIPRTDEMKVLSNALDNIDAQYTAAADRVGAMGDDFENAIETIAIDPDAYQLGARAVEAHVQQTIISPDK